MEIAVLHSSLSPFSTPTPTQNGGGGWGSAGEFLAGGADVSGWGESLRASELHRAEAASKLSHAETCAGQSVVRIELTCPTAVLDSGSLVSTDIPCHLHPLPLSCPRNSQEALKIIERVLRYFCENLHSGLNSEVAVLRSVRPFSRAERPPQAAVRPHGAAVRGVGTQPSARHRSELSRQPPHKDIRPQLPRAERLSIRMQRSRSQGRLESVGSLRRPSLTAKDSTIILKNGRISNQI